MLKKLKIKNGLEIVLDRRKTGSVSIFLGIRAGSYLEDNENLGTAHFLEHMLFEGTEKYPDSKSLAESLENIGGRSGAFTDREFVNFYVKVNKDQLEKGLFYLSDIIFNSNLENKNINREKSIILEEINKRDDNPEIATWDLWFESAFGVNHPFGRPILGTKKSIEKISKQQLHDYLNKYYFPSNMVLAIVGEFSEKLAIEYVSKYFGLRKNKEKFIKKIKYKNLRPISNNKIISYANTSQCQFIIGFYIPIPYIDSKDKYLLSFIADVLGGGTSSTVFHKLVYELGIAYSAGSMVWFYKDYSILFVYGAVSKKNLQRAIDISVKEIKKITDTELLNETLNRARERIKSNFTFSLETTDSLANFYVQEIIQQGRIISMEKYIKNINEIDSKSVKAAAKKFLKKPFTLIRGPIKNA